VIEPRITAVVLARNEAAHIVQCLRTVSWADARLVVDDHSTDATPSLAAELGVPVVTRRMESFAAQRNFALDQVRTPWVFFVDADERVPLELADEIRSVVSRAAVDGEPSGFWVPRQNLILGHWLRHAGWHPDHQLRLFRVDRGRYDPDRPVHELVQLQGADARLTQHLVHHNYVSWRQFWSKQRRYARDEAAQRFAAGERAKPRNFVLQPLREFRRRYWTLGGWRAGSIGLQLSAVLAAANLAMYLELHRLQRRGFGR
jgi:glycosyltransferase involved in cell wall biosynthesis